MSRIRNFFKSFDKMQLVVDIPFFLYVGLRNRVYGNTYIFPYIVDSGTVINQASNLQEWGAAGSGSIMQMIKEGIQSVTEFVGGAALGLIGSQAQVANLFPAPTWSNKNSEKVTFSFNLILINDNVVTTRNNYMCVNTIINNNRSMQKAILAFPGALYELWLPTGQRHLMCAAELKLTPLGLNRLVPKGFFDPNSIKGEGRGGRKGADFRIGVESGKLRDRPNGQVKTLANPHQDGVEVIPDAYQLSLTFTSCLANNLNTSIFQYYIKMTPYDDYVKDAEDQKKFADKWNTGPNSMIEDFGDAYKRDNAARKYDYAQQALGALSEQF